MYRNSFRFLDEVSQVIRRDQDIYPYMVRWGFCMEIMKVMQTEVMKKLSVECSTISINNGIDVLNLINGVSLTA